MWPHIIIQQYMPFIGNTVWRVQKGSKFQLSLTLTESKIDKIG